VLASFRIFTVTRPVGASTLQPPRATRAVGSCAVTTLATRAQVFLTSWSFLKTSAPSLAATDPTSESL
jgi:hypothetical protein